MPSPLTKRTQMTKEIVAAECTGNNHNGDDPGHEPCSSTSGTSPPDPEAAFVEYLAGQPKPAIDSTLQRVKVRAMNGRSAEAIDEDNRAGRLVGEAISLEAMARDGVPPVKFLPGELAQGVVYAVGSTGFASHPGVGKTTICQRIALDFLRDGGHVVYFDWESGDGPAVERLTALGAEPGELARLHYLGFPALSLKAWDEVEELWDRWPGALGVWDSMSKALNVLGLKENEASDVTQFTRRLDELGKTREVANLLIDHVTKADAGDGIYAGRGTGAKQADYEGEWYVKRIGGPFSDTEAGEVELRCKKKRRGRLRSVVRLKIGDGEGGLPIRELGRDEATTTAGRIRHDVRARLAGSPGERFTRSDVRKVHGTNTVIDGALATLAADPAEPIHVETDARRVDRFWFEEGRESGGVEMAI